MERPADASVSAAPAGHSRYRHPVNQVMLERAPAGQRIADVVTNFLGSWRFIIIQTAIVSLWVAGNIYLLFNFELEQQIFKQVEGSNPADRTAGGTEGRIG